MLTFISGPIHPKDSNLVWDRTQQIVAEEKAPGAADDQHKGGHVLI